MLSRDEYIEYLREVISEDPTMQNGRDEEIIYQIDDLNIYGGFEMGIRGVDHKNLLFEGTTWENIMNWGTVVIPEERTYVSDRTIDFFENLGFKNLPTNENHLRNVKEGIQEKQLNTDKEELLDSQSIEIPVALFHGSKKSFDVFELQNNVENGTDLGFGIYLTDDLHRAEMYSGDEGYIYSIDSNSLKGKAISAEEVTLTHDQVFTMIVSISEGQLASEESYPYLLSDYAEPTSETEMDEGNLQIASDMALDILNSANDDLDVINELNNLLGRGTEETMMVVNALNEQNIRYTIKKYTNDNEKISKEIVVFDPASIKILEKKALKNEPTIQEIIKQKNYSALSKHLKDGITSYLEADVFKNYLNFISKFHKYSPNNVRLLLEQNSKVSNVAGIKKWNEVGRTVKKGSKALYVFAPTYVTAKNKAGEPMKDENGQVVKEKYYVLTPVFDVSQTAGEPLPKPIYDLEGKFETPEQFVKVFKAVEILSPVPINFEEISNGAKGYYSRNENKIVLQTGLGEMMTLKTLIHEITHARLHSASSTNFGDEIYRQEEFEAESIAYIVSNHLGIDASDYSFGYLSSWTQQGKTIDSFSESLERITKEAQQLIANLENALSMSFVMSPPANKFEERIAIAQGRDIEPIKDELTKSNELSGPSIPKEERPRLNP